MKKIKNTHTDQHNEFVRLEARVAPDLKNLFVKAAKMQGTNLTNFIIHSAKKEAEAVLKQQSLIELSLKDITMLLNTSVRPSTKLKQAAQKFLTDNK